MGPWVFDFRNSVLLTYTRNLCALLWCCSWSGSSSQMQLPRELVEVSVGVNPVHPVPLVQALEKWPNLAFALEFACATVLIAKEGTAAKNSWLVSLIFLWRVLRSPWGGKLVLSKHPNELWVTAATLALCVMRKKQVLVLTFVVLA